MPTAASLMNKKYLSLAAVTVGTLAVIALGIWLFGSERYNLISVIVALVSCLPIFLSFESGKKTARELTVISAMIALTVVGRLIFAPVPGFKPVTAMTVIAGIAFGPQAGFMTGSMSALLSNIYFGQGPWTPFQMAAWGFIGLLAGLLFKRGRMPNIAVLLVYGAFSGAAFSLIMDIWTTFSAEGGFSLSRYLFYVVSALPFTAVYAVSNIVFLAVLTKPLLTKLNRIHIKYGVF